MVIYRDLIGAIWVEGFPQSGVPFAGGRRDKDYCFCWGILGSRLPYGYDHAKMSYPTQSSERLPV